MKYENKFVITNFREKKKMILYFFIFGNILIKCTDLY